MTFSAETLSVLVIVAIGIGVLALFLLSTMSPRRRRLAGAGVSPNDRVEIVLEEHARAVGELQAAVKRLAAEDERTRKVLARAVQRVGLVRYDAFEDMGGRLSFSLALLDDRGAGVMITSINGRQDTRVYAKPVEDGQAHNLSDEEAAALRQALGAVSA